MSKTATKTKTNLAIPIYLAVFVAFAITGLTLGLQGKGNPAFLFFVCAIGTLVALLKYLQKPVKKKKK